MALRSGEVGREIAALAAPREGVVAWRELRALGLSNAAIARRIAGGELWPVHPGVYAVGHPAITPHARAHAALLTAAEGAALAHRSALWLFDLLPAPDPQHVITRRGSTKRLDGVTAHRVRTMPPTLVRRGLRTTTVERALLDLALDAPFTELQRALNEADYRRLVSESSLRAVLDETTGHRGARALRAAIADKAPARSHLEDRFFALLRAAGLPLPAVNVRVGGMECDFVWPELGLVVETDGWAAHGTPRRKRRDRRKQSRLEALGWRVERVTHAELEHRTHALVARLSLLLLSRPARPAPSPAAS